MFRTLDDIDVSGKRVLLRADFNVPIKDGVITDTNRIEKTMPTINELIQKGAKIIIVTHLGRPKGERNPEFTTKVLLDTLSKTIGKEVKWSDDCVGPETVAASNALQAGEVLLCENVRYHGVETKNDVEFAKKLAEIADVCVNDAFSTAHRAHSSTEAITRELPTVAGRLMGAELGALAAALETPKPPVAALVGGAKVSSKIDVLNNLIKKVDYLIIGGGMANTFLAAQGHKIGKSLCEDDLLGTAKEIMEAAKSNNCEIILPVDVTVAKEFAEGAASRTISFDEVQDDDMILDTGAQSNEVIISKLKLCKTMVWNGPLGAFEIKPFNIGTDSVAQAAAALSKSGDLVTVAGGGDTVSALKGAGAANDFTYVSTAGGAFLEWLEGKKLPGMEALKK